MGGATIIAPLEFTELQLSVQDAARQFARKSLADNAARLDRHQGGEEYERNCLQMCRLGLLNMLVSSEYGGPDAGSIAYALAVAEIARVCASSAAGMSITNLTTSLIDTVANSEQKQVFLRPFAEGTAKAASFAMTESSAGSDPSSMRARAVRTTDKGVSGWLLSGTKQWISNASIAECFLLWARTDPKAPGSKGISCFIIGKDAAGIRLGPQTEKMGQRGNPTSDVYMDDCFVPDEQVVGEVGQGLRYALGGLCSGRLGIASVAWGIAGEALDLATRYALEREQFGRLIYDHQGLQWKLIQCHTELECARLALMHAAALKQQGKPCDRAVAMAKLTCSEKGNRICYDALQVLGGYGYTSDFPLERMCRDIRLTSIYEGTSEIQKVILGREIRAQYNQ